VAPVGTGREPNVTAAPAWRVRRSSAADVASGAALAVLWVLLWSLFLTHLARPPPGSGAAITDAVVERGQP
jgi:hypothetical protein